MSLSILLLAIILIAYGLNALAVIAVSATLLGVLAIIDGILFLVEAVHPVTVWRRPQ